MFICLRRTPFRSGFFVRPKGKCHFLCLETKKVTKENSRQQIILGRLFFRLAHAIQLALHLPVDRSNSIAYFIPSQQASKQSLSLQSGSFAKIAHWAIF